MFIVPLQTFGVFDYVAYNISQPKAKSSGFRYRIFLSSWFDSDTDLRSNGTIQFPETLQFLDQFLFAERVVTRERPHVCFTMHQQKETQTKGISTLLLRWSGSGRPPLARAIMEARNSRKKLGMEKVPALVSP